MHMYQGFSQSQTQTQQQVLSPQMLQSISLMTLSAAELRERVFEEIEKNPALELIRDPLEMRDPVLPTTLANRKTISGSMKESNAYQSFLENHSVQYETLQEHLLAQLVLLTLTPEEKELAEKIIQNLDERGFNAENPENLFCPIADSALQKNNPCPLTIEETTLLHKCLEIVRNIEPKGNACNNPQETLCWQAASCNCAPSLALDILQKYFDFLEKPRAAYIQKKYIELAKLDGSVTIPDIKEIDEALAFIRTLEPYPARRFSNHETTYVLPDILIRPKTKNELDDSEEEGSLTVIVAGEQLPVIAISPLFKNLSNTKIDQKQDSHTHDFVVAAIKQAQWFLHSLEWRNETLVKIAQALLYFQRKFFEEGPAYLAPLRLKDAAEFMDVHETTVSRIANNKYLQCEWGFFKISHFFSNAVSVDSRELHSKESVKHELKLLIEKTELEGKKLSDEKLSKQLAQKGIKIARRTVAKYRSELNINSSFERF